MRMFIELEAFMHSLCNQSRVTECLLCAVPTVHMLLHTFEISWTERAQNQPGIGLGRCYAERGIPCRDPALTRISDILIWEESSLLHP